MEKEEDKYMDKYARSLAGQGQKISPEDSDYKEKLIHVVQSFRPFDVALEQVKDVYSKKTLEEAIADRQSSHAKFADIIRTVINR